MSLKKNNNFIGDFGGRVHQPYSQRSHDPNSKILNQDEIILQ